MSENNVSLSGDEARLLMSALATSTASLPSHKVIEMYFKLNQINLVQPPKENNNDSTGQRN
jgi:hypothetical protein